MVEFLVSLSPHPLSECAGVSLLHVLVCVKHGMRSAMAMGVPPGTAYAYAGAGVGAQGATLSTVNITSLIMAYGGARAALGQTAAPLVGPPSPPPPGTTAGEGNGAGSGSGQMTASALLSSLSQPLLTTATASAARFGGGTLPVPLPLVAAGSVAGPDGRPLYIGPLAQLAAAQQVRTAALRQAIAQVHGQNLNLNARAESPSLKGDPRDRASPATDAGRRRGALSRLNRPNSAKILTSELMFS